MKTKKILHGFLAAAAAVSLILILFLSAFEIAAYSDFGFYEKEYEKYEIQNMLPMKMDDIMDVTEKMMAYLKGDRDELSVSTTIDGKEQDFFNDQDRFHMGSPGSVPGRICPSKSGGSDSGCCSCASSDLKGGYPKDSAQGL